MARLESGRTPEGREVNRRAPPLPTLLIRADASAEVGTGHIMRGLSLAQAWQDKGGTAAFQTAMRLPGLERRVRSEGVAIAHSTTQPGSTSDAEEAAKTARSAGAEWVVVDGYHFDGAYQQALKNLGLRVLAIDDYGQVDHYYADLVLNQNLHAREALYEKRESYTHLLLGPSHALLRREFRAWRDWARRTPDVAEKVLITLGGANRAGITEMVLLALGELGGRRVRADVVLGEENPRRGNIEPTLKSVSFQSRVLRNVTDMASIMSKQDLAIASSGTTSWELAFMGLPTIAIVLADNQAPIAESLEAEGVVVNAGRHDGLSPEILAHHAEDLLQDSQARRRMSERGRALVDGNGALRVVEELQKYGPKTPR